MIIFMYYVTDTHSLVWYFTDVPDLSKKALQIFEGTISKGTIIVPAVVLAEIMFISKKGRINLTFEETITKMECYDNFDIAPLDIDILKEANNIEADLEIHDKLIVATALYYEAVLLTKDEKIKKAGVIQTLW